MKKTLFFLLSFILLCSSKCKEDPAPDPNPNPNPTTEEPTDEISCLINGKEWKTGPPFLLSNPKTEVKIEKNLQDSSKNLIKIYGMVLDNTGDIGQVLSFRGIYPKPQIGSFPLRYSTFIFTDYIGKGIQYELDTAAIKELKIISINTKQQYIKGEFNFRAISREKKDTLLFTNGKFNCRYTIYK